MVEYGMVWYGMAQYNVFIMYFVFGGGGGKNNTSFRKFLMQLHELLLTLESMIGA